MAEDKRKYREASFALIDPKTGKKTVVNAKQDITNRKYVNKKK